MATEAVTDPAPQPAGRAFDRWLGHPVAYLLTAAILLTIFGWTFFANPERLAPTKDPAYYTWRTEALLTETPETLLEIEGPRYEGGVGMYSGGYRIAASVLGGVMRRVAAIAPLSTTIFLMVGIPVLTALLLGAFAFQYRRDPLIFHGVAFGAASLYLTPPFVGYIDNVLALFFLAGALLFLRDAPRSWPARIGFGFFLVMVGFTHPTTLVIFFMTLGAMALVRLVFRRFDLRSVIRDDAALLITALASIVVTYAIWKVGIWGPPASLGDAALLPPYDVSFFVDRLVLWVTAMRPALNGPLFLLGAASLLVAGRRAVEDELTRVSIVWLAPLIGVFGFLAGASYPYYRFFNTTLAWVLLVGIGIWVAARFFIGLAHRGGVYRLAWVGILALLVVIGTNFSEGLSTSGWSKSEGGWLSGDQRVELDALRAYLEGVPEQRPVVFVVDSTDTSPRIYGYTKLTGNTSRYGLPAGWIDQAHLYLGSLDNFLEGRPTRIGKTTYDAMSEATFTEASEAIEDADPIVVLVRGFNRTGSNARLVRGGATPSTPDRTVLVIDGGSVRTEPGEPAARPVASDDVINEEPAAAHAFRVLFGLLLLLLPGSLAARWLLRDASFPEWLAAAPALGISIVTLVTIAVLSVSRSPLGRGEAWVALALSIAVTGVLAWRSSPPAPDPVPR
ncbi:MAG: hypothetical protein KY391_06510 [Actinobacteria bacterium]|nr:hypothetical protein [Actinomycetota bacterium]